MEKDQDDRIYLNEGWKIISSTQVEEDGDIVSTASFCPRVGMM